VILIELELRWALPAISPAAEEKIHGLAYVLDAPDRAALVGAATETLGPQAYGEGVAHRVPAPLWRRYFHPPTQTAPLDRSIPGSTLRDGRRILGDALPCRSLPR
jgi:hypothetical protein